MPRLYDKRRNSILGRLHLRRYRHPWYVRIDVYAPQPRMSLSITIIRYSFLKPLILCDKTWLHSYYPTTTMQLGHPFLTDKLERPINVFSISFDKVLLLIMVVNPRLQRNGVNQICGCFLQEEPNKYQGNPLYSRVRAMISLSGGDNACHYRPPHLPVAADRRGSWSIKVQVLIVQKRMTLSAWNALSATITENNL